MGIEEKIYPKYKTYDNVVSTVMMNVLVERKRCGSFIVYDFDQDENSNRLYFNVTAVAADINKEYFYIHMPLLSYIKLKFKWRKRKNFRWFGPIKNKKLDPQCKTSTTILMDFISEQLNVPYTIFEDINNEYYGWVE